MSGENEVPVPARPGMGQIVAAAVQCAIEPFDEDAGPIPDLCGDGTIVWVDEHTVRLTQEIDPTKIDLP